MADGSVSGLVMGWPRLVGQGYWVKAGWVKAGWVKAGWVKDLALVRVRSMFHHGLHKEHNGNLRVDGDGVEITADPSGLILGGVLAVVVRQGLPSVNLALGRS